MEERMADADDIEYLPLSNVVRLGSLFRQVIGHHGDLYEEYLTMKHRVEELEVEALRLIELRKTAESRVKELEAEVARLKQRASGNI
jgi:predicted nuclease with TOPRIM domain